MRIHLSTQVLDRDKVHWRTSRWHNHHRCCFQSLGRTCSLAVSSRNIQNRIAHHSRHRCLPGTWKAFISMVWASSESNVFTLMCFWRSMIYSSRLEWVTQFETAFVANLGLYLNAWISGGSLHERSIIYSLKLKLFSCVLWALECCCVVLHFLSNRYPSTNSEGYIRVFFVCYGPVEVVFQKMPVNMSEMRTIKNLRRVFTNVNKPETIDFSNYKA